jgi:hypothetical protein
MVLIVLAASAGTYFFVARAGGPTPESRIPRAPAGLGTPLRPVLPTADDLRRGYRGSSVPPATPQVDYSSTVDLNTASLAKLETLPGITADYAQRILANRPYRSMQELERTGIPRTILDQVSPPAIIQLEDRGGPVAKPRPTPAVPPARKGETR